MKTLYAPHLKDISLDSPLSTISLQLDNIAKQEIGYTPWADYRDKPVVNFSIAYANDCIFLKYYVEEKTLRAVNTIFNSPVYEDSCVEFFISFDDKGYYNLEFNCIGTRLGGFRKEKTQRKSLSETVLRQIRSQATIIQNDGKKVSWQLTLVIPFEIFIHHQLSTLNKKQCRVNFYKCGNLLPEPHYLTWANIDSPEPNFHLPQFFGTLFFE